MLRFARTIGRAIGIDSDDLKVLVTLAVGNWIN